MKEKIYLNKRLIDLPQKGVTRKLQIGKVGEVASRKSTHSYTVKLPETTNNIEVLNMLGVLGNTSRKPYERIIADYMVGDILLVANGYAKIKAKGKEIELVIYDGVIDLGERLKGKKIEDLQLDDLNHILTTQTYIDSFSNTEGYIYGVADYGLGVADIVQVETQAPSIYTHTLFRKIFEQSGVNLVGDFFTTNNDYLMEVVTPSKGYIVGDSVYLSDPKGGSNTNTLSQYIESAVHLQFTTQFDLSNESLVGATIVDNEMIFSVAGTYRLDLSIFYSSFRTILNIKFKINGEIRALIDLPSYLSGTTKEASITFAAEVGDAVTLELSGSSVYPQYGFFGFGLSYSVRADMLLFIETGGQLITPLDFIGEMNQLDFILDVVRRFGLVLRPIRNSTDYEFKQFESILNDRENAEDWTDKVSGINKENYISGYAKKNFAKYSYPEEIVIPNNDGEMIIDNENAISEKTLFSSPFQIPVKLGLFFGNQLYSVPIWGTSEDGTELKETPLKVMKISRYNFGFSAKLFEEAVPTSVSVGIPLLSLINMSMDYFITNYYQAFQALIEDYNSTDFSLNLTILDIFNLNLFKLKYLKQTGRYYYIDYIQHRPNKLAKGVLIEISEFPINNPPTQIGDFSFVVPYDGTKIITLEELKTGYFDAELDEPLKIKIISGFDSNLIMKNNGITLTSETEINVDDLNLTVFDSLGGTDYSVSYEFTIADVGSGQYSSQTGIMTANIEALSASVPTARAGEDKSVVLPSLEFDLSGFANLNGSASSIVGGKIISYVWEMITDPLNSDAFMERQDETTPVATAEFPNKNPDNVGIYIFELTIIDEFGETDTDTMQITVNF